MAALIARDAEVIPVSGAAPAIVRPTVGGTLDGYTAVPGTLDGYRSVGGTLDGYTAVGGTLDGE